MQTKDNTTLKRKVALRQSLLSELRRMGIAPVILETHGGNGAIYSRCYTDVRQGVVMEKDEHKASHLACQRPAWSVYEGNSERMLAAGAGAHLPINFVDLDPYGVPWGCFEAFMHSDRRFPDVLAIAVNDGYRNSVRLKGWKDNVLTEFVQSMSQRGVYDNYLEVCKARAGQLASLRGYSLARWTGYFCGYNNNMTHYAGIFTRA